MRLTTKGRYGLRAVVDLATSAQERPISVHAIAAQEGLSADFLEQLFCMLRRSGIVTSVRGPGGGFKLRRSADSVTLKEILDAVGEPTPPARAPQGPRATVAGRGSAAAWERFSKRLDAFLSSVTLKDILDEGGVRAERHPAPPDPAACRFRKA